VFKNIIATNSWAVKCQSWLKRSKYLVKKYIKSDFDPILNVECTNKILIS